MARRVPLSAVHHCDRGQSNGLIPTGTSATLVNASSPRKGLSNKPASHSHVHRTSHTRATIFPGSAIRGRLSIPSGEERPGKFSRDFIEVDELGHGEFGRVLKVQAKIASEEQEEQTIFAVKKSKQFEGIKHRYVLYCVVTENNHLPLA